LKSAQKLQNRLETISEKIGVFNHEEELFEWEPTKFSGIQAAFDLLSPFLILYQTSVDLQRCYHNWMNGPFLKLDPELVESEVTVMWRNIYKSGLAFSEAVIIIDFSLYL
jgi:dynein heavy chain